jgi:hypothetical protein
VQVFLGLYILIFRIDFPNNKKGVKMENKGINIVKEMETFPKGEVSGELVIKNYDLVISKIDTITDYFEKFTIPEPTNRKDLNELRETSKGIEYFKSQLKEFLLLLDNEKISTIREKVNILDKILASKNGTKVGGIKYYIEDFKKKELKEILSNGFKAIVQQKDYCDDDFGSLEVEYQKAVAEGIKGKSSPVEIQNIALSIAENFSQKLGYQQMLFEKHILDLKVYCNEIEYIITDDYLVKISKEIVAGKSIIEKVKENLLKQKQDLDAVMKLKADKEAERLKAEQELVERNARNLNETAEIINQKKKADIEPLLDNSRVKNSNLAVDRSILKSILVGLDNKITQLQTEEVRIFVCEMRNKIREFIEIKGCENERI